MHSAEREIEKLLSDMRAGIEQNKFIPISRRKNIETLTALGLTWEDAKEEIYSLKTQNYISGPEPDRNRPGSDMLWIFKKTVLGNVLYIKFKVEYLCDGSVKVISFHLDEA